ncbi:MAG: hypothetical protein HYU97_06645 [Deltaproteobacteria bacterium]|nr:hypothetical protein [Deltaproteobacteria bacterium]
MNKKSSKKSLAKLPEWEKLLSAQMIFQSHFPECILVGETADADYVVSDLKKRFANILQAVEKEAGWHTKRLEPPVLILGHFQGVRTGLRQLIRAAPLETTLVRGLRIPTVEEMLRIKAYLIVRRNTTRDFIDFLALFDQMGTTQALQALGPLDRLYPQKEGNSISQQLALQLAEPKPWDLSATNLGHYKALKAPYTDWKEVIRRAYAMAQAIMLHQL